MSFPGALIHSVIQLVGLDGISKADFQSAARRHRQFGFGLQDHNRACQFLLETGFLREVNGRFFPGELSIEPWILRGIESGDSGFEALLELPGIRGKRKFEEGLKQEIGLIGENYVLSLLRTRVDQDLIHRINHVSVVDDMAGYDIRTPSVSGVWEEVWLEVKTSSRGDSGAEFYLTRNEARVGAGANNWFLVFVSLTREGPKLRGHMPFAEIEPHLPLNQQHGLRWTEVVGKVPLEDLQVDLP